MRLFLRNDWLDASITDTEPTCQNRVLKAISAYWNRLIAPGAADGLHNLGRQAKPHIFRHHFYFFDA